MITGHGDIASVLTDHQHRLYFARGVSNSQQTDEDEYDRELQSLLQQPKHLRLVYFSSLSVFYSQTRYAAHKRTMEMVVRDNFPRYAIIRIGNIDWGSNPHTLINYLRTHPEAEIQDAYRYVTNEEEFIHWVNMIPEWNCEINIPGRRLSVKEIASEYV